MVDLDELKRLAEDGQWMPADTAKKLIAVALAAQAVTKEGLNEWVAIPKLRAALEELAGSPQERRE